MTVSATAPVKRYTYSGAGEYSFSFRIFASTDLYVYILDSAGTLTVLSLGSNYTVSINTETDGGSITTTTPTESGGTLVMERILDYTQETSWDNQGPLDMTLLESSFDKLTMLLQQMQTTVEGTTVASNWRGDWATGTDYAVRDVVRDTTTGNWYQCAIAHTAGTFSTDLAANYWIVVIDFETIIDDISAMTGFALLDSPIFINNPKAPTLAPGTDDTGLATTAFVAAAVTAAISPINSLPVGSVLTHFGSTPLTGTLEADGSAISRTTYADLFAVLSTSYGVGDGSTTFNLPDMRGRFPRGWDHGAGLDPNAATRTDRGDGTTGDNIGTKQADGNLAHNHSYDAYKEASGRSYNSGGNLIDYKTNQPTTSTGGDESRPKNINVMFCIKY